MMRVKSLALIELTALFDMYNISYARRKHNKKQQNHRQLQGKDGHRGVFGVSLSTLLEHDHQRTPTSTVPRFLEECLHYLEQHHIREEGILRIPGSANRMKSLREAIDAEYGGSAGVTLSGIFTTRRSGPAGGVALCRVVTGSDLTGIVKQFIRELPEPLLTNQYMMAYAAVENISDMKQKLQALNLLVLCLPAANRNTLKRVLEFLERVVASESSNKMSLTNVAMIMAPNLFLTAASSSSSSSAAAAANAISRHQYQGGRSKPAAAGAYGTATSVAAEIQMCDAAGKIDIVRMLIKYHSILWTVPSFLIKQIRYQYESEIHRKQRHKRGKKSKGDVYKKIFNTGLEYSDPSISSQTLAVGGRPGPEICVTSPRLGKLSSNFTVSSTMTAGDIVSVFYSRVRTQENAKHLHMLCSGVGGVSGLSSCINSSADAFRLENHRLYEVGGNIGERSLQHQVNILALVEENPHCQYQIRCRH